MINHEKKIERRQKSEMGMKETFPKGFFSPIRKPGEKLARGISSHYELATENKSITFFKWALISALTLSFVISLVVLCVDVDLLRNGPSYFLAKLLMWNKQSEGSHNYEEETIYKDLIESRRALWVHMPMMGVLIFSATVIFMSILGCVAAGTLSYTILMGFSAFMFMATVSSSFLLLWGFFGDIEGTVTDKFVMKKISEYECPSVGNNQPGDDRVCDNSFKKIIDYVQTNYNCCGFKSVDDWGGLYPSSCCPPCTEDSSSCEPPCRRENAYTTACIHSFRMSSLRIDSFVGRIGIIMISVVSLLGINFIISFILFLLVRSQHSSRLRQESQLELADNYYGKNTQYSLGSSNTLLQKYNSIRVDRTMRNHSVFNRERSQNFIHRERSRTVFDPVSSPTALHPDVTTISDLLQDTTYSRTPDRRNSTFY